MVVCSCHSNVTIKISDPQILPKIVFDKSFGRQGNGESICVACYIVAILVKLLQPVTCV